MVDTICHEVAHIGDARLSMIWGMVKVFRGMYEEIRTDMWESRDFWCAKEMRDLAPPM
jgi:hypothetical protein